MSWEVTSGLTAFFLIWYLTYVLLKPKKLRRCRKVSRGIEMTTKAVVMTATPYARRDRKDWR